LCGGFYASWCINRKVDGGFEPPLKVVQARLGHASIQMTADTYGHLFPRSDDGAELAMAEKALLWKLTNGCAWNAVSAFANCGRAVAFLRRQLCAKSRLLHRKGHIFLLASSRRKPLRQWSSGKLGCVGG